MRYAMLHSVADFKKIYYSSYCEKCFSVLCRSLAYTLSNIHTLQPQCCAHYTETLILHALWTLKHVKKCAIKQLFSTINFTYHISALEGHRMLIAPLACCHGSYFSGRF